MCPVYGDTLESWWKYVAHWHIIFSVPSSGHPAMIFRDVTFHKYKIEYIFSLVTDCKLPIQ